MGRAFTRAQVAAMGPDELQTNLADINAWTTAGAIDGQAPADLRRPEGHVWTRPEVEALTQAELEANLDAINEQLSAGGIR